MIAGIGDVRCAMLVQKNTISKPVLHVAVSFDENTVVINVIIELRGSCIILCPHSIVQ